MYVAVKIDCLHPNSTEVKAYRYYGEVAEELDSSWLLFEIPRGLAENSIEDGVLLAFDHEQGRHLSRPA